MAPPSTAAPSARRPPIPGIRADIGQVPAGTERGSVPGRSAILADRRTLRSKEDDVEANEKVWTEVGERFAALGRVMKDRYQRQAGLQADDAEPGRDARDALRGLADALDGVFTAAGETIRDPAVAEEAHQAARSLGAALS